MSLELAYGLMMEYHKGQVDKSGEMYHFHPDRVGAAVQFLGPEYAMAGYLHDIVEDTPMTLDKLRELGIPENVVEAVDALTKRKHGERYFEYLNRVKVNEIARAVKLADMLDNMRPGCPPTLYERYKKSIVILGMA